MRVTGIDANLSVADIAAARDFYKDYLGLSVEGVQPRVGRRATRHRMARPPSSSSPATPRHRTTRSSQFMSAPGLMRRTRRHSGGYEIVHPLTEEAWGVRRFFVRAPDGNVINMVNHSDE